MTPHEFESPEGHVTTADVANALRPDGFPANPPANGHERSEPLFTPGDSQGFRSRWEKIQIGFVDEPRNAVQQADELVAGTIKRLAEVFAAERQKLEAGWDNNENVSTEDLRVALRRYRSFFDRLLSV